MGLPRLYLRAICFSRDARWTAVYVDERCNLHWYISTDAVTARRVVKEETEGLPFEFGISNLIP